MENKPPTQKQQQEFWERLGFKSRWLEPHIRIIQWKYPNGDVRAKLPRIDLNNLFKYAVPKLKGEYHNWKPILHDWVDGLMGDYKRDALALFWAIWKVVEKRND